MENGEIVPLLLQDACVFLFTTSSQTDVIDVLPGQPD